MPVEQIVRFVFVVVVLALPPVLSWLVGRILAKRRPAADRPRFMRRAVAIGAAGSALLAIALLGGAFRDGERQRYDRFFAGIVLACEQDCAGADYPEDVCRRYCTCYRDAFEAQLRREEVLRIVARLAEAQGRPEVAEAVQAEVRPVVDAAAERCRPVLPGAR